jgi:hypothetical protein
VFGCGRLARSTAPTPNAAAGQILFTDQDPHAPQGPIDSIEIVAAVGGVGFLLALAVPL